MMVSEVGRTAIGSSRSSSPLCQKKHKTTTKTDEHIHGGATGGTGKFNARVGLASLCYVAIGNVAIGYTRYAVILRTRARSTNNEGHDGMGHYGVGPTEWGTTAWGRTVWGTTSTASGTTVWGQRYGVLRYGAQRYGAIRYGVLRYRAGRYVPPEVRSSGAGTPPLCLSYLGYPRHLRGEAFDVRLFRLQRFLRHEQGEVRVLHTQKQQTT